MEENLENGFEDAEYNVDIQGKGQQSVEKVLNEHEKRIADLEEQINKLKGKNCNFTGQAIL